MRRKIVFIVAATFLVVVAVGGTWAARLIRRSLPQTSGEIVLPGLEHGVEVSRDSYGIPHIQAQSENDLYYALGFVNAQDRLWQLDIFRRLSQGRLAEIFGPELIPVDHRHRVLGFQRLAEKIWANAGEESKTICRAYVNGINDYIERYPDRLPFEFLLLRYKPELWSPENVYGVLMWQQWMVTFNWESELAMAGLVHDMGADAALELIETHRERGPSIIPETEKQYDIVPARIDKTIIPPEFDYSLIKFEDKEATPIQTAAHMGLFTDRSQVFASNAWAVSGQRSRSGKPMLANDPHIPHTLPSIWYMARLSAPGIEAAGIMTSGVPMIVMGHNRRIAWGDTTTGADTQDLFIEKLNPENPNEYYNDGSYQPFDIIKETIHYRENGEQKAVEKQIRLSIRGPIINEISDPPVQAGMPLSLHWAGYEVSDSLITSRLMLKAANWDDFHEALRYTATPVWNWVYADANGNIGYQLAGMIPIRRKGRGMLPAPGWLNEYEWAGYIPYDEMPRLLNPSSGYIVTANNRVTPDDYPYLISTRYANPYRAERIEELILAQEKLSGEDMQRIQMDVYSKQAAHVRDIFVEACERYPTDDPDFKQAVDLLKKWDLMADRDSAGAAVFFESYATLAREIIDGRMKPGQWRRIYRSVADLDDMLGNIALAIWFDDPSTESVESQDQVIAECAGEAVKSLRRFYRRPPDGWKWGQLHTLTFSHPLGRSGIAAKLLNLGPYQLGGENYSVNPGNYYFDLDQKPYPVIAGPSMRTVMDFGDVDAARMVITLGQSENRFSRHYADQLPLWLKGESLPLWKNAEETGECEDKLVLIPLVPTAAP
ncbi:MAG: penicillin acylase family protein [Candidatus Abyssobacteria bacterium SURF_5]|uniref:Penicillin acylase family protein n=1 Tax=Abyssobacteria bacterium (strain SURF_5) TaxID=2093360 RepID=A0A3A4NE53_ABYX5|nr:MAG: penicillin acylase family protein [Candidatus Abyssubacteria bacterium SURF_5]